MGSSGFRNPSRSVNRNDLNHPTTNGGLIAWMAGVMSNAISIPLGSARAGRGGERRTWSRQPRRCLQTSATGVPPWTCCRAQAICASGNFERVIVGRFLGRADRRICSVLTSYELPAKPSELSPRHAVFFARHDGERKSLGYDRPEYPPDTDRAKRCRLQFASEGPVATLATRSSRRAYSISAEFRTAEVACRKETHRSVLQIVEIYPHTVPEHLDPRHRMHLP